MSLFVKICGVQTEEDLKAAAYAGADAVGFVMSKSIRQIDYELAAKLLAATPSRIVTVGVFYRPTPDQIRRARDEVGFDLIQGETDNVRGIEGIVTLPVVHDGADLVGAVEEAFGASSSGRVLVEGAGPGGRGTRADWEVVQKLDRLGDVILAGGLSVENVANAIETVHPGGVDVSSGVESRPGVKDPTLIAGFIENARRAEKKVVI